ncbi:phosphatase PAP2 family protein [Thermocrinis albus]|uniref:phosphatase PAP2 family protein n=1 Tax=Thermocrinis albus TaxID=136094 RepID=UPI00247AB2CA|nr:phosphatase PAP2 family protein [Thermocrinis albus]
MFFFPRVGPYGRLLLSVYALLIAYGRIYVGAHFPLDVLVGALLGLASCLFVRRVTGYG